MWILAGIINNKIEENVKSKDVINLNDISDNSFVNNVHNKNNENNLSVNQKENGSINPNELLNNNNNPKVESEIVERLSSSSSDNGDIKIISSQQFTDHFQKRNEPKARIEVVENNIISNKDIKDFLRKRKQRLFKFFIFTIIIWNALFIIFEYIEIFMQIYIFFIFFIFRIK